MKTIEGLFKEWQSLQPVKEDYQKKLDQKFMLEFNYNSNHIEGNTLTYGQTEMLLMFGKVVNDANMRDLEEMKASNVGLKMVKEMALDKEQPLTESFIRILHNTLLREDYIVNRQLPDGTNTSYVVHAGQYKTRPNSVITVTGETFEYASPEETPALMADLLKWYNDMEKEGKMTPIELATLFHYRYIRIHPFEDGNGRISRLIVNYILYRHGYPMIVVKSSDKDKYLTALNQCDVAVGSVPADGAHAELSQVMPFVDYMSKCLERALTICIKGAKGESIEEDDDWKKNLRLKFRDKINKPAVTDEIANKILKEDFKSLLLQIDNELSEFYSVFTTARWDPKNGKIKEQEENVYYADIDFSKNFNDDTCWLSIRIQLSISQFLYTIEILSNDLIGNKWEELYKQDLSYNETISEQDKKNMINVIGQYINQFLETEGFSITM